MISWSARLTWNFSDCSVALRFVFLTQKQRLNCVHVIISTPVRLPLPGRLLTVPNITSSLLMLFFVKPLFKNLVINCRTLQPLHSYRLLIKICFLYWTASKLSRLLDTASKFALFSVSGLKDKSWFKKQTYMKTETCKTYFRVFWTFVPNIIKIDPYIFELYRFKIGSFFWDTVYRQD